MMQCSTTNKQQHQSPPLTCNMIIQEIPNIMLNKQDEDDLPSLVDEDDLPSVTDEENLESESSAIVQMGVTVTQTLLVGETHLDIDQIFNDVERRIIRADSGTPFPIRHFQIEE